MRKNRFITIFLALAAVAAMVFSCIEFKSVIWPSDPKANSEMEVTIQVQLVPETEHNGHFVLAFVAPKSWKVSETVQATYSATNAQVGGQLITITDEVMVLANDYTEPTTTMPYSSAMLSQYGVLGNTGPVEWIVLRGTTYLNLDGSGTHPTTTADVKVKFKTGPNNIKFFSAFVTCLSDNGFNTDHDGEFIISDTQMIKVTGGSGNDDFTVLHYVSTTPQTFRYGDYVSIEFVSSIDGNDTALYGESQVYLNATCTLADGTVKEGPKTLMTRSGDETYFKYIYPKSFFGVGQNAEIVDMHVWFTNADGSIVVTDGTEGFEVSQASE